jgi:hypothetical protein
VDQIRRAAERFGTIATKQDSTYINYSLFLTSEGELAFYWVDLQGTHSVVSSGIAMNAGMFITSRRQTTEA